MCYFLFFFFSSRRRHTRFDCDWSSDVCSSDLFAPTGWPPNATLYVFNTWPPLSSIIVRADFTMTMRSAVFAGAGVWPRPEPDRQSSIASSSRTTPRFVAVLTRAQTSGEHYPTRAKLARRKEADDACAER